MPWLTGNATTPTIGRRLLLPDDENFIAAVRGALLDLTREQNWQQFGTVTPEEAAAAALDMLMSIQGELPVSTEKMLGARIAAEATQNLANNSSTAIKQFDTLEFDTAGMYNAATPNRLIAPADGLYHVEGAVAFTQNATGIRRLHLMRSGNIRPMDVAQVNGSAVTAQPVLKITSLLLLAAGEYVEILPYQNSGASMVLGRVTINARDWRPFLSMYHVG